MTIRAREILGSASIACPWTARAHAPCIYTDPNSLHSEVNMTIPLSPLNHIRRARESIHRPICSILMKPSGSSLTIPSLPPSIHPSTPFLPQSIFISLNRSIAHSL